MTRYGRAARAFTVLSTACLLGSGCGVFGQSYHLAADAPKSSDFRQVVLLPSNFDRTPISALASGTELITERVRRHLEEAGFEVVAPSMSTTLALWKECIEDAGGILDESGRKLDTPRYETARSDLMRRMLASHRADGVVAPAVIVRKARIIGSKLSWDGVQRPVPVDIAETNLAVLQLHGNELGVSLRTSVFDRSGRNVFERFVGLEPLRGFRVKGGRGEIYTRTDLFQDESIIQHAVVLSFEPWLPSAAK
jgi:hypothetical protein